MALLAIIAVVAGIAGTSRLASAQGNSYDEADPGRTVCATHAAHAHSIMTTPILNVTTQEVVGRLDLMWSPQCGTNWAHVQVTSNRRWTVTVRAYRNGFTTPSLEFPNATEAWSLMVYAPDAINGHPSVPAGVTATFNDHQDTFRVDGNYASASINQRGLYPQGH